MNCTGKYLKVWKVEDKGSVKLVDLGDSRKNQAGEYENCTWFGCLFCGDAASKPISEGDKIEITSGMVFMEKYNDKWSPKVKVFHFDVMEGGQSAPVQQSAPKQFESYKPSSPKASQFEDDIPF